MLVNTLDAALVATSPAALGPAVCAIMLLMGPTTIPAATRGKLSAQDAPPSLPRVEQAPPPVTQAPAALQEAPTPRKILHQLHRWSGLTWDQIADLFGVDRRSVHFWSSGRALNAENEEHLFQIWAVFRTIDRGFAPANRAALLNPREDGVRPLDLLTQRRYDEVRALLGKGKGRPDEPPSAPVPIERKRAYGLPVEVLANALQDPIAITPGPSRPAFAVGRRKVP